MYKLKLIFTFQPFNIINKVTCCQEFLKFFIYSNNQVLLKTIDFTTIFGIFPKI